MSESGICIDINECLGTAGPTTSVSADGVCSKSSNKITWAQAKADCESKGGHLYCPETQEQIDFVTGDLNDIWIGWNKAGGSSYKCPHTGKPLD